MPVDKGELDRKLQKAINPEPKGYPRPNTVVEVRKGAVVYEEAGKIEASLGVAPKKNSI